MVCGSPTPTIHRDEDGPGIEPLTACTHHSKVEPGATVLAKVKLVPVIWLEVADLKVYWPEALRIVTMYPVAPETVFQFRTGLSSDSSKLLVVS